MTSRHPSENPDDDEQMKLLRAVHDSLNYKPLVSGPADAKPLASAEPNAPHPVKPEDVEAEPDRIEAYLRGPTAFTA
ncbi:hypothetical protein [Microvirga splendida]|uniref:Uncharacterized protein n=1 Tax=Microvirga splendida TaxID=2795727 RepID=A0ABS0XXN0_9HYPH|nr:hypothetical protein [Microvirga splendida]MBJ6124789.1 hypothetical protein [Microvirga splendida]